MPRCWSSWANQHQYHSDSSHPSWPRALYHCSSHRRPGLFSIGRSFRTRHCLPAFFIAAFTLLDVTWQNKKPAHAHGHTFYQHIMKIPLEASEPSHTKSNNGTNIRALSLQQPTIWVVLRMSLTVTMNINTMLSSLSVREAAWRQGWRSD